MAEKLTCSAPTITARVPTRAPGHGKLLQGARGEDPGGPIAGNETRRTRPLANSGGEDDGVRVDVVEREDGCPQPHLDADSRGVFGQRAGIPRARHHAVEVAHPEAEMVGVSWDPAGLLLAFVQRDVPNAEASQRDRGREARRSAADDHHATIQQLHGATLQPVRLHSSAWQ